MGIGLAIARHCAKEGAQLILASRHARDLRRAIKAIKAIVGNSRRHISYCLDVSNEKKVKEFATVIKKGLNSIDGLVNCAGIIGPIGKLDEINPENFAKTVEINLLGTFYMCHYFISLLKKKGRGKIINFSGGGAATPFPNYCAYAASKAGIVRLTESIAGEYKKDKIDINVVAPGFVITRLHQETIKAGKKAGEAYLKETLNQIAKGGVSPDTPSKLVLFLLSSDSDGITGKFISAPWDSWEDLSFQKRLKKEKDFLTLRRIDDKMFCKKEE